jgi:hypothetical protein
MREGGDQRTGRDRQRGSATLCPGSPDFPTSRTLQTPRAASLAVPVPVMRTASGTSVRNQTRCAFLKAETLPDHNPEQLAPGSQEMALAAVRSFKLVKDEMNFWHAHPWRELDFVADMPRTFGLRGQWQHNAACLADRLEDCGIPVSAGGDVPGSQSASDTAFFQKRAHADRGPAIRTGYGLEAPQQLAVPLNLGGGTRGE